MSIKQQSTKNSDSHEMANKFFTQIFMKSFLYKISLEVSRSNEVYTN